MRPKENGWYKCNQCTDNSTFLFHFELLAHWRENHGNFPIFNENGITSSEELIERDNNLAKNGWICQMCPSATENFDYKFQLINHWYNQHLKEDNEYKMCRLGNFQ